MENEQVPEEQVYFIGQPPPHNAALPTVVLRIPVPPGTHVPERLAEYSFRHVGPLPSVARGYEIIWPPRLPAAPAGPQGGPPQGPAGGVPLHQAPETPPTPAPQDASSPGHERLASTSDVGPAAGPSAPKKKKRSHRAAKRKRQEGSSTGQPKRERSAEPAEHADLAAVMMPSTSSSTGQPKRERSAEPAEHADLAAVMMPSTSSSMQQEAEDDSSAPLINL